MEIEIEAKRAEVSREMGSAQTARVYERCSCAIGSLQYMPGALVDQSLII
jgi:hypothetical protein